MNARIVCSCTTENLGITFKLNVDPACPVHRNAQDVQTTAQTLQLALLSLGQPGPMPERDLPEMPWTGPARPAESECWCEYVDIGVGMQKVAENYGCPRCFPAPEFGAAADTRYEPDGPVCIASPNGPGPACDWDAACPVHGAPANASLSGCWPEAPFCRISVDEMCPFHH